MDFLLVDFCQLVLYICELKDLSVIVYLCANIFGSISFFGPVSFSQSALLVGYLHAHPDIREFCSLT